MASIPGEGAFMDESRIAVSLGLAPGMHVADLGCGSGYFTVALARVVGSQGVVTAVDVMMEPLESVQSKAEHAGFVNVRTKRADLEVLGGTGIPDGSQDLALMKNVLFQSEKKGAILAEAARILKPGGRMVIIDWKKGAGGIGPPDELRTSDEDLRSLAQAAGVAFSRQLDIGRFWIGLLFTKQ
jgi:ubiquinone/menaquinone biosynthesis C-methylase UbiE